MEPPKKQDSDDVLGFKGMIFRLGCMFSFRRRSIELPLGLKVKFAFKRPRSSLQLHRNHDGNKLEQPIAATPRKANMTMDNPPFEDAFDLEHADFLM